MTDNYLHENSINASKSIIDNDDVPEISKNGGSRAKNEGSALNISSNCGTDYNKASSNSIDTASSSKEFVTPNLYPHCNEFMEDHSLKTTSQDELEDDHYKTA